MRHLLSALVVGLALTSTAALSEPKRDDATKAGRDAVFVSVTCEDLSAAARARHAACAPGLKAERKAAPAVFEAPVRLATREVTGQRRIVRIPWSIGVFQ